MIPIKLLMLTILLGCQAIFLPGKVYGQSKVEGIGAHQINCSITVESDSWSQGKPASVVIELENISDKDIKFWTEYYFELKSVAMEAVSREHQRRGDGYWSAAGVLTKQGQLVMVAHDLSKVLTHGRTSGRFPNEAVSLRKGESKQIKVDLSQLLWQDRISSIWPDETFFAVVPKGKYWLSLEMEVNKQGVNSNRVEVRVE